MSVTSVTVQAGAAPRPTDRTHHAGTPRHTETERHDEQVRREVARAALTATWIALAVMSLPLAVAIHLLLVGNERSELERAALRAAIRVDPAFLAGDPVELPAAEPGGQLALYDTSGRRRAGTGPARVDLPTQRALAGQVEQDSRDGNLVLAVPVLGEERVLGAIRASSPTSTIWWRSAAAWTALGGLVVAALSAAVVVARRGARRLAEPLERLATASSEIGDGNFDVRLPECGIEEIDLVNATQNSTAERLADLLARERQFSANASHQLRTPLTALQLLLEKAASADALHSQQAVTEALQTAQRLQRTVDDVLALHRRTASGLTGVRRREALGRVLTEAEQRWHGPLAQQGRALVVGRDGPGSALKVAAAPIGQILDVLVDNTLRHGSGQVDISTRELPGAMAVDVRDEGAGIPTELGDVFTRGTGQGHGIGLALAREFAQSLGGRLILSRRTPPVFTLILPVATDEDRPDDNAAQSDESRPASPRAAATRPNEPG